MQEDEEEKQKVIGISGCSLWHLLTLRELMTQSSKVCDAHSA